jgi:hypothetical protein
LSKIFDNHQLILQYAEHDLAEERWRYDAADQSKRCWYPMMPSQEPQSAKKSDDPRRQDSSKNLKDKLLAYKITGAQQKAQGGFKETHIAIARRPI